MISRNRAAAFLLLLFAVIIAAALVRGRGPAPGPANAPASQFSAQRAITDLRSVIGNIPHPVGSAEHDAVRDRIVARFHSLGYDTQVQHAFACSANGVCAPVDNIIARMPYAPAGDALALAAHYDSVPAGAGVSDDGVGVAVLLEVARVVRTAPMRNALLFVMTDAEELGLLGANAFADDPNVSGAVAAVINVDNRGTSGLSYLFETSAKNAWLLPLVASMPRPASSSLFFDIYQLLPNDTDMTVFKAAGKQGLNFGFIGGVTNYHTPLDDLAHVTPSTVQDHGDHVLAMARALGNAELRQVSSTNATWFDVLNFVILWWRSGWTAPIAVLALIMIVIAALLRMRENAVRARQITWGVVAFFASIFGALLIAFVLTMLAGARAAGLSWVAFPLPAIAMAWLTGIGSAIAAASFFRKLAEEDGLLLGAALSWCVLAIATAAVLPGGSYLFLIPAVALTVCAVLRAFFVNVAELTAAAILTLIAAVLFAPLALTFYTALGRPILPAVAAIVALIATAFSPVVASAPLRRITIIACFGGAVVCAIVALALPPATRAVPRRLNVGYLVDGGSRSMWTATGPLGNAFRKQTATWAPWNQRPAWAAPAPAVAIAPPALRVVSDERGGKRVLTLQLHSNRNAPRMTLAFHTTATVDSIRVNGIAIPPQTNRRSVTLAPDWHRVVVAAPDAQVQIVMRAVRAIDAVVLDSTRGLPPEGAALARAREAADCVMSDSGDETTAMTRMRF